ncbi:MAG: hemolysin family protein [Bifidobacteriaceae bacterium]|jgi:CBS domain containing-hemolysin-like protein|nr:hemolysin family protein [Bifidobacteriaceae bacterium]
MSFFSRLGARKKNAQVSQDDEQLDIALEQIADNEDLEEEEKEMIKSVVELGDTIVREVMVPRTSMEVLEKGETLKNSLNEFLKTGYSRMPVIGENSDDILGIAYFKDVVRCVYKKQATKKTQKIEDIVRKAVFVPESMTVDALLRQMQESHSHIAIAIDEYGGVAGLVTLEDALEEIVGEVVDEFDKNEEAEPEKIDSSTYKVSARMSIDDLSELFEIDLSYEDIDTVGGLFTKALGSVPKADSVAEIDGLKFWVDKINVPKRQILQIIVQKI